MNKSTLVDLEVYVHHRTEKAVLVSDDGDSSKAVWFPLSQCEIEPHETLQRVYVLTCEQRLAEEKGIV